MIIRTISFTRQGSLLAAELKKKLHSNKIELWEKYGDNGKQKSLYQWTKEAFGKKEAILFIGACGIAVRAVSPFVSDKLIDSPVLVADEEGRFVIPILSGHVGGANELARELADTIGAVPVITTATDIRHNFAVDIFAVKNHLTIINKNGIAAVSAKILAGVQVTVSVEGLLAFDREIDITEKTTGVLKQENLPKELKLVEYPPKQPTDIIITTQKEQLSRGVLQLKPKEYVLGIGCKRNKSYEEISQFISVHLDSLGITEQDVCIIASIDLKKKEEGILQWKDFFRIPYQTYTEQELNQIKGSFNASEFVKNTVGVDNVCERAAIAACGKNGILVLSKQMKDGITLAVAKRKWTVQWEGQV